MPKTEEKVEIKVKVKTKTAPEPKERKDKSKSNSSSSKLPKLITNLLSKKTELKKISPEIDDHMDKNLPCFVIMGEQSTAKSATASRILGCVQLETSNERCTKVFYEYTMIAAGKDDKNVKDYQVRINHGDDEFYKGTLDLDKKDDKEFLLNKLIEVQQMIGAKPENDGKTFYNTTVGVEILSPKIHNSFVLIDTPGLIQLDIGEVIPAAINELNAALMSIPSIEKYECT